MFGKKSQTFFFDGNSCQNQSISHENISSKILKISTEKWVCTLNKSQIISFWLLLRVCVMTFIASVILVCVITTFKKKEMINNKDDAMSFGFYESIQI